MVLLCIRLFALRLLLFCRPEFIVVEDAERAAELQELLKDAFRAPRGGSTSSSRSRRISTKSRKDERHEPPTVLHGVEALEHAASLPDVDCVLLAISGFRGLRPGLAALRAGKDVALATKEVLVAAGSSAPFLPYSV